MPKTENPVPRIGIIGGGSIAGAIVKAAQQTGFARIAYVLVSSLHRKRSFTLSDAVLTDDAGVALAQEVDLVIEAALPDLFATLAPRLLEHSDFCGFSCTALADADTRRAIEETATRSGFRCHVPHGAVLGLDGLADGRDALESVRIITTKGGHSLGVSAQSNGTIFEGTAREACRRFPRSVNVHAAVALAGIGFDRTESQIVAVPGMAAMQHRIEVRGKGLSWDIDISSQSLGGVTGTYTPASAVGSVRRILSGGGGIRIA